MAEKQAVFTLKVDTGNSVQDVQNFDHAVQSLNKDLKETQATASKQTGLDSFESKLQELDERLKAGGLSMRDMTKLMKEYQNLASAAGQTSPVGERAIQNAGQLKDTIGDLKAATVALSSDTVKLDTALAGIETGAAAFQGVQSAIALTGVESEQLVQTMVKLQAVQGLVNAVTTISNKLQKDAILGIQVRSALQKAQNFILYGSAAAVTAESTATKAAAGAKVAMSASTMAANLSLKLFRGALIASGIGVAIVLIGALIANFDKILKFIQPVIDEFKKMADFIGLTDFAGEEAAKNEKARQEEAKRLKEEDIERDKRRIELQKELKDATEDNQNAQIALLESQGQSSIKLQRQIAEKALAEAKFNKDALLAIDEQLKKLGLLGAGFRENAAKLIEADTKLITAQTELNNVNKEAGKIAADNFKKAQERRKAILDNLQKQFDDELKLQDELEKAKLALITDARKKELAAAQGSFDDYRDKFLIERTKDEKAALDKQFIDGKISREKYNAELLDLQKNAANKLTDAEREIILLKEQKLLQDVAAINKKFDAQELLDLAEKEKKTSDLRESFNAIFRDQFDKQTADAKKANDEQLKNLDEAVKAGAITEGEAFLAKIKLANDLADTEKKIEKDKNEFIKAEAKKARDEQLEAITKVLEGAQKALDGLKTINGLVNEIDQARLNSIENRREEDLANLDANLQAQLNQEGLTAEQKTKIEEKFAQQKYNVQVKAFAQEEKIKKAQFMRNKALQLAQVAMDTASAIVKGMKDFGPPPNPLGIAAIASAGIIGITQALAIANQQYQSGTAPTAPQLGPGGSAGSLTGESASSFTANTNTQTTDLTTLGQGSQSAIPISQVVVLESDITGTQNKVRLQEAKTSF
jgi:hypothetical protein